MISVDLARKWRALAQRRKAHLVDLYHSGRWRLYYSEADFAERLCEAVCLVDRWTATVRAAAAEAVGTAAVHGLSSADEWADIDLILLGPLEPLGEHAAGQAPAPIDGAARATCRAPMNAAARPESTTPGSPNRSSAPGNAFSQNDATRVCDNRHGPTARRDPSTASAGKDRGRAERRRCAGAGDGGSQDRLEAARVS